MKIVVFGANGLLGSSLVNNLSKDENFKTIPSTRNELDLLNGNKVKEFIHDIKPNVLINAAGKVGGILSNRNFKADFIIENSLINLNIAEALRSYTNVVNIAIGSSAMYSPNNKIPFEEHELFTGELDSSNRPYSISKLTNFEINKSLHSQYGVDYLNLIPTNLYGQNDNFSETTSHVIPGLIYKFHNAKIQSNNEISIWGSGFPKREFLHVDDLSEAIIHLLKNSIFNQTFNIGSGEEISIKDLSELICKIVNYKGEIIFDPKYPDGANRKLLNSEKINNLGWNSKIKLKNGLMSTYEWYIKNLSN